MLAELNKSHLMKWAPEGCELKLGLKHSLRMWQDQCKILSNSSCSLVGKMWLKISLYVILLKSDKPIPKKIKLSL